MTVCLFVFLSAVLSYTFLHRQTAVGAFFDSGGSSAEMMTVQPEMALLGEVTNDSGRTVSPNEDFTKTWHLVNTGKTAWSPSCTLNCTDGERLFAPEKVRIQIYSHTFSYTTLGSRYTLA